MTDIQTHDLQQAVLGNAKPTVGYCGICRICVLERNYTRHCNCPSHLNKEVKQNDVRYWLRENPDKTFEDYRTRKFHCVICYKHILLMNRVRHEESRQHINNEEDWWTSDRDKFLTYRRPHSIITFYRLQNELARHIEVSASTEIHLLHAVELMEDIRRLYREAIVDVIAHIDWPDRADQIDWDGGYREFLADLVNSKDRTEWTDWLDETGETA